ncbi:MAG: 50S ribosomal protein L21 [Clostridia bacterium]
MYAIIVTGGKQYKVQEGDVVFVEKLICQENDVITIDNVIAVSKDDKLTIGTPTVEGAKVTAKVVKNGKDKKIMVFKYKAKKNYRNRKGHRQPYTKIQIESITA